MSDTRIGQGIKPTPNVHPGEGGEAKATEGGRGTNSRTEGADVTRGGSDNGRGRGNAYGQTNKPARVREIESQSRLVRSKLDGPARDTHGKARETGRPDLPDAAQRGGRDIAPEQRHAADGGRNPSPERGGREPHGNAEGWFRRGGGDDSPSHARGRDDGTSHAGRNPHDVLSHTSDALHSLTSSARDYLYGLTKGENLPPAVRHVLDSAAELLGRDFVERLGPHDGGRRGAEFIERALAHVGRQLERVSGPGPRPAQELVHAAVREVLEAAHLERHFDELGRRGGNVVREAEAAVARALYGMGEAGDGAPTRIFSHEVLRDLRSGAFSPVEETYNPFPLTGRARVVTEMMELMRALDAIERGLQGAGQGGEVAPGEGPDALFVAFMQGAATGEAALATLDSLLAALLPTLPGRAGRLELLRFVAALDGKLVGPQGMLLVSRDGTPLKLEQLLWLGLPEGLLRASFAGERSPVQLSPLLLYGFDAVYSAIGFDGRTLGRPHFAAVQAQVNGSELEWVFGQPPLTEGWMRALIERLKDSASADHNLLGEMLEEALAEGRFHAVLVGGRVEEGEPVAGSFSVTRLLPGAAAEAAFSPA